MPAFFEYAGRPCGYDGPEDVAPSGACPRLNICMISDFFWPAVGGVETHIYQLSHELVRRGHKVIVVTHAYEERSGVRYLTNSVKVYYLPLRPFVRNTTVPIPFATFPLLRNILIREQIQVVHGHAAGSTLAQECVFHSRTMGYPTCLTDHSLYQFFRAADTAIHKVMQLTVSDIGQVICVSHTAKENTVLRTGLNPSKVSVIPNGIAWSEFTPDLTRRSPDRVVVVVVSRLVYRKGVDLLRHVIPAVCAKHASVDFLVAGDGDRAIEIEEMRERLSLDGRVRMLGEVRHDQVRDVLCKGHIFLNCSLTEAFCMAIVEAASCGLLVVTTNVGGITEVLPGDLSILCEPSVVSLCLGLDHALSRLPEFDALSAHKLMKGKYSWSDVARRTEVVYKNIYASTPLPLAQRLHRLYDNGPVAGKLFLAMGVVSFLLWKAMCYIWPVHSIDVAPTFRHRRNRKDFPR